LYVQNAILLIAEPDAHHAIGTALEVISEGTVVGIETQETVFAAIASVAIYAVVHQFAVVDVPGIHNILGVIDGIHIETVFHMPSTYSEIAVLAERPIIGVFTVDAGHAVVVHYRNRRHDLLEVFVLLGKSPAEIKVAAVGFRVPAVAPPAFLAIHGERQFRRINGNDISFAQTACPPVIIALISEQEPSLKTARGTSGRRRNSYFFIKRKII